MLLVWLTRNEVLRTREYYADLRVLEWEGTGSALPRIFDSQPAARAWSAAGAQQLASDASGVSPATFIEAHHLT